MEVFMATTSSTPVMDAIRDRLIPTLDAVEKNARRARRAVAAGSYAAEDLMAGAKLRVRQRPLDSVMRATIAGALAGCIVGFMLRRRARPVAETSL
jgi:hypothetical protein